MSVSKGQTKTFLAAEKGNACCQVVLITWYDGFKIATHQVSCCRKDGPAGEGSDLWS
jgi:hypothetical protein